MDSSGTKTMDGLAVERLSRADLEALAAFKLWCELGVTIEQCAALILEADPGWLRTFLGHGPKRIGLSPLDETMLLSARVYVATRYAA